MLTARTQTMPLCYKGHYKRHGLFYSKKVELSTSHHINGEYKHKHDYNQSSFRWFRSHLNPLILRLMVPTTKWTWVASRGAYAPPWGSRCHRLHRSHRWDYFINWMQRNHPQSQPTILPGNKAKAHVVEMSFEGYLTITSQERDFIFLPSLSTWY